MLRRLGLLAPAMLGLVLLGAAPNADVERLLRDGNEAFERGEYEKAIDFYQRAEDRATDPGRIAYNKANALYRLALEKEQGSSEALTQFRAAEDHYRRSAEGAEEPRRSRALFGLANSLVQGRGEESAALQQAVRWYRECLRSPDRQVAEDARHNLELAKILWLRARTRESQQAEKENKNPPEGNSQKPPPMNDPNTGQGGDDPMRGQAGTAATQQPIEGPDGDRAIQTNQQVPGPSNTLPPLRDDDKLSPLTPEEAEQHLAEAMKRIQEARKSSRFRQRSEKGGTAKDS